MTVETEAPCCRRCRRPVEVSRAQYEVFEQMHYVCYHYEFEHDSADPDEECSAGGCPSESVYPRPDRRPSNVLVLSEIDEWFAERGLGVAASSLGLLAGPRRAWVDLTSRNGQVLSTGYGSGGNLAEAAVNARRRWEAETERRT